MEVKALKGSAIVYKTGCIKTQPEISNTQRKQGIFMRLKSLAIVLTVMVSTSSFAQDFNRSRPERLGFDADRLERLDPVLQSYIDTEQISGSVTLVLRNGRIAYSSAKGMRNIDAGLAMEEDSIFRIASQTKAIVSTGIMMLHERGILQISDPLSKFFPAWAEAQVAVANDGGSYDLEPLVRPITLRDLLTHTSGIGYGMGGAAVDAWTDADISGWYFANKNEPIGTTVTRMASLPIEAQPGEEWIYGYNIDILGAVIEVASGRTLAAFLQEEILNPLEMDDTHFYLPQEKADRLAVVYTPASNGGIEPIQATGGMQSQGMYVNGPRVSFSGGAGLLSTAPDYAKFLQMTLNGGEYNNVRLLSPKTIELMTTSHIGDIAFRPGEGMGLGFSIAEDLGTRGTLGSEGEYGWGGAYHSTYWVDPQENLVVVYMTQILSPVGLNDFDLLRAGIYQAIVE
jgi:CubicO group peptidase (beta-lactamase class C family)